MIFATTPPVQFSSIHFSSSIGRIQWVRIKNNRKQTKIRVKIQDVNKTSPWSVVTLYVSHSVTQSYALLLLRCCCHSAEWGRQQNFYCVICKKKNKRITKSEQRMTKKNIVLSVSFFSTIFTHTHTSIFKVSDLLYILYEPLFFLLPLSIELIIHYIWFYEWHTVNVCYDHVSVNNCKERHITRSSFNEIAHVSTQQISNNNTIHSECGLLKIS